MVIPFLDSMGVRKDTIQSTQVGLDGPISETWKGKKRAAFCLNARIDNHQGQTTKTLQSELTLKAQHDKIALTLGCPVGLYVGGYWAGAGTPEDDSYPTSAWVVPPLAWCDKAYYGIKWLGRYVEGYGIKPDLSHSLTAVRINDILKVRVRKLVGTLACKFLYRDNIEHRIAGGTDTLIDPLNQMDVLCNEVGMPCVLNVSGYLSELPEAEIVEMVSRVSTGAMPGIILQSEMVTDALRAQKTREVSFWRRMVTSGIPCNWIPKNANDVSEMQLLADVSREIVGLDGAPIFLGGNAWGTNAPWDRPNR